MNTDESLKAYTAARELIDSKRASYPADVLGLLNQWVDAEKKFWDVTIGQKSEVEAEQRRIEEEIEKVKEPADFQRLYYDVRMAVATQGGAESSTSK